MQGWEGVVYTFNDSSQTIPTYIQNEEKGKNSRRQKGIELLGTIKNIASLSPSNTGSTR